MEHATLIFALPVTIIAWLVMASFTKALRMERAQREGRAVRQQTAMHGGPDRTWRQRLKGIRSYPSKTELIQFMEHTAQPALSELVEEFTTPDSQATLDIVPNETTGIFSYALMVPIPDHRDFLYQVQAVEAPIPTFGGRTFHETDVYYRAEVFAQTGSEGYDLMGLTQQQIIDDVLGRYESHLAFLTYSNQHNYASELTPSNKPATAPTTPVAPPGTPTPW